LITFANENAIEDMANEIEKRNEAFLIYQDENGIARKITGNRYLFSNQ